MEAYAAQDDNPLLTARRYPEPPEEGLCKRGPYQRDRDRILHARSFRRMMHKTQIFNANLGEHYRNRLTHTLEVSQIARSIGKVLKLNDELIEAIALAHDLGHTPFGHTGERTLHGILSQGLLPDVPALGLSFKHNFQSLRVTDQLETRCDRYPGINLTLAVREGILKHTKPGYQPGQILDYPDMDFGGMDLSAPSFTLEGQVAAVSDEIAQCTHDLEDGVRSKIIPFADVQGAPLLVRAAEAHGVPLSERPLSYDARNRLMKNLVGFLIEDVCRESLSRIQNYLHRFGLPEDGSFRETCVFFSPETALQVESMLSDIHRRLVCSERITIADTKAQQFIRTLFRAYYLQPKQLPDYMLQRCCKQRGASAFDRLTLDDGALRQDPLFLRALSDYIAGMTDQYAAREFMRLTMPEYT